MFGLTNLGTIHTAIGLVALIAGAWALARDKAIVPGSTLGKVYIWTTVLTCLSGFGIFQRGGFGPPHVLGIITLVVLGVAWGARRWFGRAGPYVQTRGLCRSASSCTSSPAPPKPSPACRRARRCSAGRRTRRWRRRSACCS